MRGNMYKPGKSEQREGGGIMYKGKARGILDKVKFQE
jgi:hypothetical protein